MKENHFYLYEAVFETFTWQMQYVCEDIVHKYFFIVV